MSKRTFRPTNPPAKRPVGSSDVVPKITTTITRDMIEARVKREDEVVARTRQTEWQAACTELDACLQNDNAVKKADGSIGLLFAADIRVSKREEEAFCAFVQAYFAPLAHVMVEVNYMCCEVTVSFSVLSCF